MQFEIDLFSLRKLMVSHDLPRSTVTNQIAFDQRDLYSTPEFDRTMDRRCQALVSKLEPSGFVHTVPYSEKGRHRN